MRSFKSRLLIPVSFEPGGAFSNNFIVAQPPPSCSGKAKAPGDVLLEIMVPGDPYSEFSMNDYASMTTVYFTTDYGISPLNLTIDSDTDTPMNADKVDLAGRANRWIPFSSKRTSSL